MTLDNLNLTNLNYISQKLVNSAKHIWDKLDDEYRDFLIKIIDSIMLCFDRNKYFVFKACDEYILIEDDNCNIEDMGGVIDDSNVIINNFNQCKKYKLKLNNKIIIIYHNKNDDITILNKNIKKIMTRLCNLFTLYKNKFNKQPKCFNLQDYEYIFYLYNNPRRVNRDMTGAVYLQAINNSHTKCFNTVSGVTELGKQIIRTSRMEDCLGLLTHEVLHGCGLININNSSLSNHGIKINFTEAFTNMFASIIHVYLTCIEYKTMEHIRDYLLIELIHSINHTIKFCIMQNITIESLFAPEQLVLHQDVYMYEYIVVKMLFFINFNNMLSCFTNRCLSLTKPWTTNIMTKYIQKKFIEYNKLSDVVKIIDTIHRQYLNQMKESTQIDGNMIMAYHAIDTMIIESNKEIKELYGGGNNYKQKYIKYKNKYIKYKNILNIKI